MSTSALTSISKCIDKSKQLLDLAKLGDWDGFSQLESQRQSELLDIQLQGLDLSDSQHEHLNNQMQILIDLNTELEQLCRQQRSELSDQMKNFTQGNKAKKAYSQ